MNIRSIILYFMLVACSFIAMPQVQLSPVVSSNAEGLGNSQTLLVENKLRTVLSIRDMLGSYGNSRFILAAHLTVIEKEVLPTAPIQVAVRLLMNIAIGDGMSGVCFGNCEIPLKGIGQNDGAAITAAIRNFSPADKRLNNILEDGTNRIINYYNQEAPKIIKNAQTLATQGKYDEAIYELSVIPKECDSYDDAQSQIEKVYKQYVNHNSAAMFVEAQALWSANPTAENAANVMSILSEIDPEASNYSQVRNFMQKVEKQITNENAQRRAEEVELEKARLNTIEKVAKAYADSQPKTVYYIDSWWY